MANAMVKCLGIDQDDMSDAMENLSQYKRALMHTDEGTYAP